MAEKTITERIRSAEKYLGVSRQELMEQMIEFYELGDNDRMRQMFEAYKDWEIQSRDGSRTIDETIQLAKKNFDCVARVADGYVDTGDIISGMVRATQFQKSTSGQISRFYREAIDYQPSDPTMN